MSDDDLLDTPSDIDQTATRIAGNYLDAPISCAKLYREVVAALMAERAAKDTALSEITDALHSGEAFGYDPATGFLHADDGGAPENCVFYVPKEALSEMRAELERARKALQEAEALLAAGDAVQTLVRVKRALDTLNKRVDRSITARAASKDEGEER